MLKILEVLGLSIAIVVAIVILVIAILVLLALISKIYDNLFNKKWKGNKK